jgi:hypothetical protein
MTIESTSISFWSAAQKKHFGKHKIKDIKTYQNFFIHQYFILDQTPVKSCAILFF